MLSNISDLFTMASLAICMLLSGIIFYYLRTRINMLEQSVMEQAQLLQQVLRHSQNQQQQLQPQQPQQPQQIAGTAATTTDAKTTTTPSSLQQQRLITVSDDDSDSSNSDDDSDDSDDDYDSSNSDDDYDSSDSDDDDANLHHHSKSIDLSAIMSNVQLPSSSNFFENSGSNTTEIKVIELKHCFNGNDDGVEYFQNGDHSDSESESESESESDGNSDSDGNDSDNSIENNNDKGSSSSNNNGSSGINNIDKLDKKKHFEKINKEPHPSLDVPVPLKNMPVNMLRDLAKTKLTHLEQPTINKMSKKEILKALDS